VAAAAAAPELEPDISRRRCPRMSPVERRAVSSDDARVTTRLRQPPYALKASRPDPRTPLTTQRRHACLKRRPGA